MKNYNTYDAKAIANKIIKDADITDAEEIADINTIIYDISVFAQNDGNASYKVLIDALQTITDDSARHGLKYYEVQTKNTNYNGIFYNSFYTSAQAERMAEAIADAKEHHNFIHCKEITEREYIKYNT